MRDKLDYLGYGLEAAYFHKKNEELLKKLREKKVSIVELLRKQRINCPQRSAAHLALD